MASKQSKQFQLNLWEPEDAVLRTEFNENTQKIEDAIVQLTSQAFSVSNAPFVFGSFVGNGQETQKIYVGFHAKFVLIAGCYGLTPGIGIALEEGIWMVGNEGSMSTEGHLTEKGFLLPKLAYSNVKDRVGYYIAFR